MVSRNLWAIPVTALVIAGCARDGGPVGPVAGIGTPDGVQTSLSCQADVRSGSISCTAPGANLGGASGALIGGQGEYVLLESSGVAYDPADPLGPTFSANVALRNYLSQALGTTDGVTADPNGIRIFFVDEPQVTAGSGVVTVRNVDGTAEFTKANQPYFQYDGILAPGKGTGNKTWQWDVPETVEAFTFLVGVSASVPNEAAIEPGVQLDASTLSVGHDFNCALDKAGKAYCWGANDVGQLGIGAVENRDAPTPVAGGLTFSMISAGELHACGLTLEGDAYCWGEGANYRLGNGSTDVQFSPVAVGGGVKFTSISAGGALTCGISVDGDAYCWGSNGNAKTGQGTTSGSTTQPTVVRGGLKYKSISAGYYQACAITSDDTAVCWGNGNSGRAGDGNTGTHNLLDPTPIVSNEKFSVVKTGSAYSCGLTLNGTAYCWGGNGSMQLGDGTSTGTGTPTAVLGGHTFTTIDVRFAHTCATKANGEAWCWGNNDWGRLGTGNTEDSGEPVKVQTNVAFDFVGVGRYHTCGISTEGGIYCWGRNDNAGQLGTGRSGARYTPAPITIIVPES